MNSKEHQQLLEDAALAEEMIPYHELEEHAERVRMGSGKNWDPCTISDAECVRVSDGGALLVVVGGEEYWIPEKLVTDESEVYKKDTEGDLIIPTWLAVEKGLV